MILTYNQWQKSWLNNYPLLTRTDISYSIFHIDWGRGILFEAFNGILTLTPSLSSARGCHAQHVISSQTFATDCIYDNKYQKIQSSVKIIST